MHDLAAGLVFLLVSCISFTQHSLAVIRLARQPAASAAEALVSSGYVRTVSCRVLAATTYIVVAALQLAGIANLTETTIVFTCVQVLWMLNSRGDVRTRARIMPTDRREVRLPGFRRQLRQPRRLYELTATHTSCVPLSIRQTVTAPHPAGTGTTGNG